MSFDYLRRMAYKDYNVYKDLATKWDDEYLDLAIAKELTPGSSAETENDLEGK